MVGRWVEVASRLHGKKASKMLPIEYAGVGLVRLLGWSPRHPS